MVHNTQIFNFDNYDSDIVQKRTKMDVFVQLDSNSPK